MKLSFKPVAYLQLEQEIKTEPEEKAAAVVVDLTTSEEDGDEDKAMGSLKVWVSLGDCR